MARRKVKTPSKASIGKTAFNIAKFGAAPLAFLKQISEKDRADLGASFDNASLTTKAKQMVNIVLGRVTGFNPFNDVAKAPQTINPAGIINPTTNAGGIMLVYGVIASKLNKHLGMSILPASREFRSIGKSVLTGGAVGGFFDPPMNDKPLVGTTGLAGVKLARVENGQSVPQGQITTTYTYNSSPISVSNNGLSF